MSEKSKMMVKGYWLDEEVLEKEEFLEVPFFPQGVSPANVCFSMELCRQIRQYEPIKVFCSVSLPCMPHETEIKAALAEAKILVDGQMAIAHNEIKEAINQRSK